MHRRRLIDAALWASTAGFALITLLFSFGSSLPVTDSFALADKFGHGLLYFASFLSFLLAAVWRPGRGDGLFPGKGLLFALGVVAAGVAVEVLQEVATTDRHAQLGDVLSETIGAFAALAVHAWMRRGGASADCC